MNGSSGSTSRYGDNSPAASSSACPVLAGASTHPHVPAGRHRRAAAGARHRSPRPGSRPADVGGQRGAAPGGVEPAQHVPAEACGRHLIQELGCIAQQHADMHRPVAVDERQQRGGAGGRVAQVLAPRPLPSPYFTAMASDVARSRSNCWMVSLGILLVLANSQ